jgi:hypothetical protein
MSPCLEASWVLGTMQKFPGCFVKVCEHKRDHWNQDNEGKNVVNQKLLSCTIFYNKKLHVGNLQSICN